MARARVVYRNLADDGTVTASSQVTSAPATRLQDVHRNRRWKGRNGDTESILLVFDAAQSIDFIGLFGCAKVDNDTQSSMTETAITRIRVSSVDTTGVAGDLFDSGSIAGQIKEAYGALVKILSAPVSAIAVHINVSEAGAEALLAGRLVVGLTNAFTINFSWGWSFGYSDLSRRKKSAGGQTFIDLDDKYRVLSLEFGALEEADRYGFVEEIDRLNGISSDIAFIIDPASTNLTRDTVWGLMNDLSPPSQPNFVYFSKSYSIEERL